MLTIADDQMQRLQRAKLHDVDPKIDAWLLDRHPNWQSIETRQRRQILSDMVDRGQAAGMAAETDYALYCDVMVRVGPAWQRFAASDDYRAVVGYEGWRAPEKLNALSELAMRQATAPAA